MEPSLDQAFEAYAVWARERGRHIAEERSRYRRHVAPRLGGLALSEVAPDLLAALRDELLVSLSPQSVFHVLNLLRRVINHSQRTGLWSGENPVRPELFPAVPNLAERFFCAEEAERILRHLRRRSPLLHDLSLLSLKTGLRAGELLRLRCADVDLRAGEAWILGKGRVREMVRLDREACRVLRRHLRPEAEHVFRDPSTGCRLRRIPREFMEALAELGINEGVTDRRQLARFHTWRHTFASWLAQSGRVDLRELMRLMRHRKPDMTRRYAHLMPACPAEGLARLAPRLVAEPPDAPGPDQGREPDP